jgi:hypothetical protein
MGIYIECINSFKEHPVYWKTVGGRFQKPIEEIGSPGGSFFKAYKFISVPYFLYIHM